MRKTFPVRERGFSLIELLLAIVFFSILVGLSWPALQKLLLRNKLEAVTRETSTLFAIARYESIKTGLPTVVRILPASSTVQAFVDDDDNGDRNGSEKILRSYELPSLTTFGGPAGGNPDDEKAVVGFSAGPAGQPNQVIFNSDGSVRATGSLRLRENKPGAVSRQNYLEVRIPALAAMRVTVRKWDSSAGKWTEQGEGGKSWEWKM